jgi:hypothetical protein
LENLVQLHGQNYFAGPKVPRNLSKERDEKEERQKRVIGNISQSMRSKH